jgi:hypothetical protein
VRVQDKGVTLSYAYRRGEAPWQNIEQWVSLTWTPCRYGGQRPWVTCPGVVNGRVCGRRVAILYDAGHYFLCRHCYNLTYESQREDLPTRLISKAQKIRQHLGGSASLIEPFPPRPKGMHCRTYSRLYQKARSAEMGGMHAMLAQIERMTARVAMGTLQRWDVKGGNNLTMVGTKPHKTSLSPAYKPLSPEQENAIDLLILG